jgi:hypothetical protein
VRRNLLQREGVPAALSAVLCVAVASLGSACSEEQYNPAIGAGGSTTVAAAGSAGQSGSAGSGTSNGGGSAGASGGAGGAGQSTATQLYAFQSSLEGFFINYYCTGPAVNTNCTQLQAQQPADLPDAGADAGDDAGAAPEQPVMMTDFFTLEQDPTLGSPAPGSAKLTLHFTSGAQSANFAMNFGSGTEPGIDLAGKTLQAQVRVEAGAPATTYAKMYIKTGATYYYADSGQKTLVADSWTPITFAGFGAPSYPSAPDPTLYTLGDVREIGIELGATDIPAAVTAAIHIDSVSY